MTRLARNASAPPPFRRQVFYLPGYDPFPPRRYRELYRREGAAQAALSGYDLALKAGTGAAAFHVTGRFAAGAAEAEIEVLVWSDLVRASMRGGVGATYIALFRVLWVYLRAGILWRLMRLRKGPVIAALYPLFMLILQAELAVLLAVYAHRFFQGLAALAPFASLLALALIPLVLRLFRAADRWFYAYYLMQDYAFTAGAGGAYPPALAERLEVFAAKIRAALARADVEEVLIVGHSSGAHLAVSTLALVLKDRPPGAGGPALSLLTLGQVVPMVSFLPQAYRLRADLQAVGESEALFWADVTAPGDGCAFALCDPLAVSGLARAGRQKGPLVLSAAFTQTLSPARWRALRWQFLRLHFQYLCAFDALPGRGDDYDYFAITAGPLTLRARLGARPPSPSRLTAPCNPHPGLAP